MFHDVGSDMNWMAALSVYVSHSLCVLYLERFLKRYLTFDLNAHWKFVHLVQFFIT